jgi:hypothetical protein
MNVYDPLQFACNVAIHAMKTGIIDNINDYYLPSVQMLLKIIKYLIKNELINPWSSDRYAGFVQKVMDLAKKHKRMKRIFNKYGVSSIMNLHAFEELKYHCKTINSHLTEDSTVMCVLNKRYTDGCYVNGWKIKLFNYVYYDYVKMGFISEFDAYDDDGNTVAMRNNTVRASSKVAIYRFTESLQDAFKYFDLVNLCLVV